jgi:hypothetical protein
LEEDYLKTLFGKKTPSFEDLQGARIVIFKYICQGILQAERKNRDHCCAVNFVIHFPLHFKEVAVRYPHLLLGNIPLISMCSEELECSSNLPFKDKADAVVALNGLIKK